MQGVVITIVNENKPGHGVITEQREKPNIDNDSERALIKQENRQNGISADLQALSLARSGVQAALKDTHPNQADPPMNALVGPQAAPCVGAHVSAMVPPSQNFGLPVHHMMVPYYYSPHFSAAMPYMMDRSGQDFGGAMPGPPTFPMVGPAYGPVRFPARSQDHYGGHRQVLGYPMDNRRQQVVRVTRGSQHGGGQNHNSVDVDRIRTGQDVRTTVCLSTQYCDTVKELTLFFFFFLF